MRTFILLAMSCFAICAYAEEEVVAVDPVQEENPVLNFECGCQKGKGGKV